MVKGVVATNIELASTTIEPAKCHVEVSLPANCEYRSGDYLAVQGHHSDETVSQIMTRFGLSTGDLMTLENMNVDTNYQQILN
ncbi:uncharacterized protein BDW47DRAFT_127091 [Aspergillus candidus]|uniref:Uncharacterized protein n=1 Tax=Aspergillus candidus TaxID=41067 RepID=A0A2I2F796_ASPCN|nr:hypothetical protein BDW47DRAFT_127091 [Aspergillus candidus]PLB36510.1 hypothetical protein BDW47DRAFT_127091 [Aspergillus candidus]